MSNTFVPTLKAKKGYIKKKDIIKYLFNQDDKTFYRQLYALCKEQSSFKESYNKHNQSSKMPIKLVQEFLDHYLLDYTIQT